MFYGYIDNGDKYIQLKINKESAVEAWNKLREASELIENKYEDYADAIECIHLRNENKEFICDWYQDVSSILEEYDKSHGGDSTKCKKHLSELKANCLKEDESYYMDTKINPKWTIYDQTVASSHLNNYGIIFCDKEYGTPIDDEYELDTIVRAEIPDFFEEDEENQEDESWCIE